MRSKIWLSAPHMGGKELDYIHEAFETNWIAPLGPNVSGFENDLESYLGEGVHIAALSSGTAAMHLALILLGVKSGDEVICQSMTFSASANPIVYQGAIPVFVDSEPDTWNMCPDTLEDAIKDRISKGKKPKAIIYVHLYGMPAKIEAITTIARKYDIPLIEDAAEALGSTYKGKKCGTFGDLSILSFNGNKIITTSGGGALVAKDKNLKEKTVFLATQAKDDAPHYQHSQIGYNYRLSNIAAGIGRGQMKVLDTFIEKRRQVNASYQAFFAAFNDIDVFSEPSPDYFSTHWLSCIVFNSKAKNKTPDGLRVALLDKNIQSRPLWKPMHLQPVFNHMAYYGGSVAQTLFEKGLCLPSGSNLTETDKDFILNTILNYLNS